MNKKEIKLKKYNEQIQRFQQKYKEISTKLYELKYERDSYILDNKLYKPINEIISIVENQPKYEQAIDTVTLWYEDDYDYIYTSLEDSKRLEVIDGKLYTVCNYFGDKKECRALGYTDLVLNEVLNDK